MNLCGFCFLFIPVCVFVLRTALFDVMCIRIIVVPVLIALSSKYFLLAVQFESNRLKCALNLCFVYFVMSLGPSFASAEKCLPARQSTADWFEIFQNLTVAVIAYEWQSDNVYVLWLKTYFCGLKQRTNSNSFGGVSHMDRVRVHTRRVFARALVFDCFVLRMVALWQRSTKTSHWC